MKIKLDKARGIDVPYGLMEVLWRYSVRHRQKRERNQSEGKKYPVLFLTEAGEPYSDSALTKIFGMKDGLSKRVGFHVHPHMLRHTYATFLLWSLRKSTDFRGDPLMYVQERMGHSDISSTIIYLHLINSLEGQLVLGHGDEIDKLFAGKGTIDGSPEEV